MRTIWREELDLVEKQSLTAPGLYRILSISRERGVIEAWFDVDESMPPRSLDIWIVGTGQPIPDEVTRGMEQSYLGHVMTSGGAYVWHLFSVETPGQE